MGGRDEERRVMIPVSIGSKILFSFARSPTGQIIIYTTCNYCKFLSVLVRVPAYCFHRIFEDKILSSKNFSLSKKILAEIRGKLLKKSIFSKKFQ